MRGGGGGGEGGLTVHSAEMILFVHCSKDFLTNKVSKIVCEIKLPNSFRQCHQSPPLGIFTSDVTYLSQIHMHSDLPSYS